MLPKACEGEDECFVVVVDECFDTERDGKREEEVEWWWGESLLKYCWSRPGNQNHSLITTKKPSGLCA